MPEPAETRPEPAVPRILVIEDDVGKRYTIVRQLRQAGFEVWEAATGEDGLRQVQDHPDLVILDIKLPDVDGFEVCRRIKADPATRMVLVLELSARFAAAADRVRGLEEGADAYLIHPVEGGELLATVRALLRLQDAERARRRLAAEIEASEQRYRTVTETASVGLFLVDGDGRCTFMNRAAEEITGRRFTDLVGRSLHDELHPTRADGDPYPAAECPVHSVAVGSQPVRRHRDVIRMPDGQLRPVEMSASPIEMDGARHLGAVIEVKDVSDMARAELQRELFLAALGHDLRNPLQTLALGGEVLARSPVLRDRDRETLERMQASARRMRRLIEQLLVFAQSLVEGVPVELRPTDLADLVRDSATQATVRYPDRSIQVVDELGTRVECDPDRISQLVENLLGNALKHGDGTVTVRLGRDADQALLAVHNGGKAIGAEHLPTLFDPFRGAGSRTSGGVGLGLYIVDQIARAHGGRVDVRSHPGDGTTFLVRLPIRASASS